MHAIYKLQSQAVSYAISKVLQKNKPYYRLNHRGIVHLNSYCMPMTLNVLFLYVS